MAIQAIWREKHNRSYQQTQNETRFFDKRKFTTATSASSAQVQLQMRSAQLPTPARNFSRNWMDGKNSMNECTYHDAPPQALNERHIFIECEGIAPLLDEGAKEAQNKVQKYMEYHNDSRSQGPCCGSTLRQ